MKYNIMFACLFAGIIGVALAFRLPALGLRPMHHDEANQAVKCGVLQETGVYKYDPGDHHGPSLYYLTLPFVWFSAGKNFAGTSEITFRIVPVLFGVGVIVLLLLVADGLGRGAVLSGAALIAISPAMIFYSRFYIQEMLLVFFTLGAIAAGWRYFVERTAAWAAGTGFFLGMMFVTKETSVIAYASMAGALLVAYLWEGCCDLREAGAVRGMSGKEFSFGHFCAAVAVAGFVWITFFTSFFTNWAGAVNSILAYRLYFGKSIASLHLHPWYYYLQILARWKNAPGPVWSEGLILVLAFAGLVAVLKDRIAAGSDRLFVRFLAIYTILLTGIYSAIPYKTPWCLLSFLSGMILLAGVGVVFLFGLLKGPVVRLVFVILLAVAGWNLARQAWATNFKYYADPRNPYVYAHTSRDFLNLVKRIETLAKAHAQGRQMFIAVVASPYETWPLPWYLRGFPTVGFWVNSQELPEGIRPAVAVVSAGQLDGVVSRLGPGYHSEYFGLRPDVLLAVFVAQDLWDAFIK